MAGASSRSNVGVLPPEASGGQRETPEPPPSQPSNRVDVDLKVGRNTGRVKGVDIGHIEGPAAVTVNALATPAKEDQVYAPPVARHAFFRRSDELDRIERRLRSGDTVLVHGMAGIGKTTVAAEAVKRLHGAIALDEGILWLSEIDEAPMAAICDAIARRFGDDANPNARARNEARRHP